MNTHEALRQRLDADVRAFLSEGNEIQAVPMGQSTYHEMTGEQRFALGRSHLVLPTRACKECRSLFQPRTPNQVYCTPECSVTFNNRKAAEIERQKRRENPLFEPKPCAECGTEFQPRSSRGRFCSEKCGQRWHGRSFTARHRKPPLPKRVCVKCGAAFQPIRATHVRCSGCSW